jgi:septum formation protein
MILPYLAELSEKKVILASLSPRRKKILSEIGLEFDVIGADVEEGGDRSNPSEYALKNAEKKSKFVSQNNSADLIIASDTIVVLENKILEKPKNKENAREILSSLSGKNHAVISAVSLVFENKNVVNFFERTEVKFKKLNEAFLNSYLETDEPYDKAGAYGLQGIGSTFVEKIEGDYFNVIGFPVSKFSDKLIEYYGF